MRRPWPALALVVVGMVLLGPVAAQAAASPNLLVNPGAELGIMSEHGLSGVTVPGWRPSGDPTVVPYGASVPPPQDDYQAPFGFPTAAQGPPDGGRQFFGGGLSGNSTLSQTVDLASAAAAIDAGGITYTLSGWLGGYSTSQSEASVTVTFLGADGRVLGSGAIGPVSALDRAGQTELLDRTETASVPAGTRRAEVVVTFTDLSPSTLAGTEYTADDTAYADDISLTVSAPLPAPGPPLPPASRVGRLQHVFMVFMENEGDAQIVDNPDAPYLNSLISANGFASNYHGLSHPSDQNYVATFAGSDYGVVGDCTLSCTQNVKNLADEIEAAHETWAMYNQSMPTPCDTVSTNTKQGDYYDNDDTPWLYFGDILNNTQRCKTHVLPMAPDMTTALKSTRTTPNYVWFSANDYDDMEQGGIGPGDTWLSQTIPLIEDSAAWKTQRSAIFITFDEDAYKGGQNLVPMIVLASPHSGMLHGPITDPAWHDHYSLTRTIELALGLPPLTDNDKYATPLNAFWPAIPALSGLRLIPSNIPAHTRNDKVTLAYRDSAAALTTFVVLRSQGRHGRYLQIGHFTHADTPGSETMRLPIRLHLRRFQPGRYLIRATPRNTALLAGPTVQISFTITH